MGSTRNPRFIRRGLLAALLLSACAFAADALASGRLADVAIYDRSAHRSLPLYWHDGRAYVVGTPGNEYEIRIRSHAGAEVLAVVSVDGVNVLSGQAASPQQSGYVVNRGGSTQIQGWRKSLSQTAAFYFTPLGDSYAARTDRPQDVGVIGVALFERKRMPAQPLALDTPAPWEKDTTMRSAAPAAPVASGANAERAQAKSLASPAPSSPLGTGHGRREDSAARYVEFERATDAPAETIAIYYDSYRNLVAQGVIPTYGDGGREPRPFPGAFVPDPR
jgi:hypothetical protein